MIPLSPSQIDSAVGVLARAFRNDSEVVYYFPDEANRDRLLPMYRLVLNYGIRYGETYTTSSTLEGIAAWLPPGRTNVSMWKMLKCGAWSLPFKIKPSFLYPYISSLANVKSSHLENAPFPHWYLFMLCVDDEYQSQGFASKLLKPMLDRIDNEKLPCYLETTEDRNLPIYRHFGFKVVESKKITGTPLGFWAMLRDAR